MPTSTMSGPKLITSKKKLIHSLVPNGEKCFWDFYVNNMEAIESVIESNIRRCAHKYIQPTDIDEIHQEVLMALDRTDVLGRFDPSRKVRFNTYFTREIRGGIYHWFTAQKNHKWDPTPSEKEEKASGRKLRQERVYFQAFNGVHAKDEEVTPVDVLDINRIEEDTSLHEALGNVRVKLDKEMNCILDLLLAGFNKAEIARMLDTNSVGVSLKVSKVAKVAERYFK